MSTLAPVDVEAMLVSVLDGPVSTRVPNPRPAAFTRVSAAGGDPINAVQSRARVLVECWAASSEAAFERASDAWSEFMAMRRTMTDGVFVSRVELTLPVNFPDPSTSSPRYQFVASLTIPLARQESL